jgi:hypothetical protein
VLNTVHRRRKKNQNPPIKSALSGCPGSRKRTRGLGTRSLLTDRQQQIKEWRWHSVANSWQNFPVRSVRKYGSYMKKSGPFLILPFFNAFGLKKNYLCL